MRHTLRSALVLVAILTLVACDQKKNVAGNAAPSRTQQNSDDKSDPLVIRDKQVADLENDRLDMTLECPVRDLFLDGTTISDIGTEKIYVQRSRSEFGEPKNGVPQFYTVSNSKITSNGKVFDSNLIGSSPDYLLISYGHLLQQGIGSGLFIASYMIDLKTKRLKRSLSFFPNGKDVSSEGECK